MGLVHLATHTLSCCSLLCFSSARCLGCLCTAQFFTNDVHAHSWTHKDWLCMCTYHITLCIFLHISIINWLLHLHYLSHRCFHKWVHFSKLIFRICVPSFLCGVVCLVENWSFILTFENCFFNSHTHTHTCKHTQTHTQKLEWACYRTSDLQLLSPGIGTWFCVCVFVLCAAGRTDDSSCASLPTRAALLPSNTDQTAVARRRVKCSLKPLISLSCYSLPFFFITASYY